MSTIALTSHQSSFPSIKENRKEIDVKSYLIKKVALASLKELAISLAIGTACCFFVSSPVGIILLVASAVAMVGINTLIRSGQAKIIYKLHKMEGVHTKEADIEREQSKKLLTFLEYLCPFTFGFYVMNSGGILLHEGGHALAAMAVYRNPHPRIGVSPFDGGVTSYSTRELTSWGSSLGRGTSRMLVSGAGAGISIAFSMISIALAHKMRHSNPQLSKYLLITAIFSIIQHVAYAISAFFTSAKNLSHDFIALWVGGIHPLLAITVMILLPLLLKGVLYAIDYFRGKLSQDNFSCQPVPA